LKNFDFVFRHESFEIAARPARRRAVGVAEGGDPELARLIAALAVIDDVGAVGVLADRAENDFGQLAADPHDGRRRDPQQPPLARRAARPVEPPPLNEQSLKVVEYSSHEGHPLNEGMERAEARNHKFQITNHKQFQKTQ
jgi:hypothetical protein